MNFKALHTLEYDKIIAMLESYAASPLGKEYCTNLLPSDDEEYILKAQQRQAMPSPIFLHRVKYHLAVSKTSEQV